MEEQKTELKMIRMSEVESQEVKWLWYPFIPYGKLTIIQGDPGDGKTTLVLNIAAKLSKGESLDSDMDVQEPVNVIYQTAEDGLADTVKPRLELAGADCEKILVIDESDKSLSMADERLEEALAKTGAKVLILDPIQAYLGGGMDMNRANEATISQIDPQKVNKNILRNKPEHYMRDHLCNYLTEHMRYTFTIEPELGQSKRELDIYFDVCGELYFIEIKWLGISINDDGSGFSTKYTDSRARDGVIQTLEYIEELMNTSEKSLRHGYLAVYDARDDQPPIDFKDYSFVNSNFDTYNSLTPNWYYKVLR